MLNIETLIKLKDIVSTSPLGNTELLLAINNELNSFTFVKVKEIDNIDYGVVNIGDCGIVLDYCEINNCQEVIFGNKYNVTYTMFNKQLIIITLEEYLNAKNVFAK